MVSVKVKRLNDKAVLPSYAKEGDAGIDLVATSHQRIMDRNGITHIYGTGLAVEFPPGYVMDIRPRGSIKKTGLELTNSVGTVDSGYRGELMVTFRDATNGTGRIYEIGDRIAQMLILPCPLMILSEVDELSDSERGEGKWGSTGK